MFTPEAMAGYASTAVFTIINLVVTYLVLKKFLFKPILKVLNKRKTDVENELNQAEEKLTHAEEKLSVATARLDNSSHEAAVILAEARNQADAQKDEMLLEAKHEAATMLTRADTEVGRMRVTMLNNVRDEVADLSVSIATKVIGQVMDEQRQRELVEKFLDESARSEPVQTAGSQSGVSSNA